MYIYNIYNIFMYIYIIYIIYIYIYIYIFIYIYLLKVFEQTKIYLNFKKNSFCTATINS